MDLGKKDKVTALSSVAGAVGRGSFNVGVNVATTFVANGIAYNDIYFLHTGS
jgi:hypothetical protein